MPITPELVEELRILSLYNLGTTQEGIKIHKTAEPGAIAAAQRLHRKGLITQADGGYLTGLGLDAAMNVQAALTILNTK